jgi:hypothetical protein
MKNMMKKWNLQTKTLRPLRSLRLCDKKGKKLWRGNSSARLKYKVCVSPVPNLVKRISLIHCIFILIFYLGGHQNEN